MSSCSRVYGIQLKTNFPFSVPLPTVEGEPDLLLRFEPGPFRDDPPAPEAPILLQEGQKTLSRIPGGFRIRIANVATFELRSGEILCHAEAAAAEVPIEICLLGTVFGFWLETQGLPTLHASAVVVEGSGVAFLGRSQSGKTSLAAKLVEAGQSLLTDDLLALEMHQKIVLGRPGYPSVRAWPDLAERLVADPGNLPKAYPNSSKKKLGVGTHWGQFHDLPVPLAQIFLPERRNDVDAPYLEPVSPRDSTLELIRYSFLPRLVAAAGLEGPRLERLAKVAARVPMRRLVYPAGWERLDEACQLVLGDLA